MIVSFNGKIISEKSAKIPVVNEDFFSVYAIFETIRTYNKKIFRLKDHLSRLYNSADIMDIKPKWKLEKANKEVCNLMSKNKWKEIIIRIIFTKTDVIITVDKLEEKPSAMYRNGVKAVSFAGQRNLPSVKKIGDSFCFMAKKYAESCNVYESFLIDDNEYVRECAYANIFWVKNKKLYTIKKDVFLGITRQTVIELAQEKCLFKDIKYKSLLASDEIFITQTTSGILPVVEIDGHKIGNGHPGSITKKLMKKFEKLTWG